MAASTGDKITDIRNAARPNSARASGSRSAGGVSLACDNLAGWPTASKVHFVTYQIDSASEPVAGTQLDCSGIVSGNTIGSFTVIDGTDTGNSVNDVVEMLPTAGFGQDLVDALMNQHTRTGAHTGITTDTITITSGTTLPAGDIVAADISGIDKSLLTTDSNPYKFWAYQNSAQAITTGADRQVSLQAEAFDTNNNFSTATYLYTAPVAGFYFFSWAVTYPITSNSYVSTLLYVNGANTNGIAGQFAGQSTGGTQTFAFTGAGLLQLAANDTVGLYMNVGNNANLNAFRSQTYLQGFLISRT
jgi:hypothetical protein